MRIAIRDERSDIVTKIFFELLLRPKPDAAHRRVQSVATHHDVETAVGRILECDLHAAFVILQTRDAVAEHYLDFIGDGFEDRLRHRRAED